MGRLVFDIRSLNTLNTQFSQGEHFPGLLIGLRHGLNKQKQKTNDGRRRRDDAKRNIGRRTAGIKAGVSSQLPAAVPLYQNQQQINEY